MSGTIMPTTQVRLVRRPLALMLGTYSFSRMMRRTRASVSLEKRPFWLITRETVAVETPARRAMSLMLFPFSKQNPPCASAPRAAYTAGCASGMLSPPCCRIIRLRNVAGVMFFSFTKLRLNVFTVL